MPTKREIMELLKSLEIDGCKSPFMYRQRETKLELGEQLKLAKKLVESQNVLPKSDIEDMERINLHDISEGKDFKLWRLRLESLLCHCKDLLKIVEESSLEKEYHSLSPHGRKMIC